MNPQVPFKSTRSVRVPGFYWFFLRASRPGARVFSIFALVLAAGNALADTASPALPAPVLPDASLSLLRVMGALALVLGLFLGGAWLFKNWQRLSLQHGRTPRLGILETRSLGPRQAVFVVGYERQRFLVAASPAGVNLLSHLPDADAAEAEAAPKTGAPMSFSQALTQVLKRK
jgi:flagellar biogenesis protein FliO